MSTHETQKDGSDERHATLQEVEVAINDLDPATGQERITAALKGLPGIRQARLVAGGIMIICNPVGISPKQIHDAIERGGFTVDGLETGYASPINSDPPTRHVTANHTSTGPTVHEMPGGLDDVR